MNRILLLLNNTHPVDVDGIGSHSIDSAGLSSSVNSVMVTVEVGDVWYVTTLQLLLVVYELAIVAMFDSTTPGGGFHKTSARHGFSLLTLKNEIKITEGY